MTVDPSDPVKVGVAEIKLPATAEKVIVDVEAGTSEEALGGVDRTIEGGGSVPGVQDGDGAIDGVGETISVVDPSEAR